MATRHETALASCAWTSQSPITGLRRRPVTKMKVLESNLAAYITATLLDIKRGCFDAFKNGDVILRLPNTVRFTVDVVGAGAYNTIIRTQTTTPAANRVTTIVDAAYQETSVRIPSTIQTDNSSQGGTDNTTITTTYTQFVYTTS
jgi:hypothetical protein